MLKEFLAGNEYGYLPLVGMAAFLVVFALVVVRVLIGWRQGQSLDYVASLPLEEDGARPLGRDSELEGDDRR